MAARGLAVVSAVIAAGCGGGGGGGSTVSGNGEGGGGSSTVSVSGATLMAPVSAGAAFGTVPDGTAVELVALDNGSATVLARTTVAHGRYQFNNVAAPAGLSTRTLVRVMTERPIRAFATASTTDVSPLSEAVIASLASAQQQGDGRITAAEYDTLRAAAGTLVEVARSEPAAPLMADAEAIAALLAGDAAFGTYRAAAAEVGTTLAGVGDVGNLYPAEVGHRWQYTDAARGANSTGSVVALRIGAQVTFAGRPDALRVESDNFATPTVYRAKDTTGVFNLGGGAGNDLTTAVRNALGPLPLVSFPVRLGTTTQTGSATNAALPLDLDGDRQTELFSATATMVVGGVESMTVLGSARAAVKITNTLNASAKLSSDGSVGTLTVTDTFWLVRDLGVVRSETSVALQHPLLSSSASSTSVLLAHAAPGSARLQFAGGELLDVPLAHTQLIPDAARGRVLAITFGTDVTQGRALASVDLVTGQIQTTSGLTTPLGVAAVAPDGTVFVAAKPGLPDCQSVPEILQLNANTLAVERRLPVVRNPGSFCEAGAVTAIEALSSTTLLVQTDGNAGGELLRLDDGVRAPNSVTSPRGSLFLSQPLVKVLVSDANAYFVSPYGGIDIASFGPAGFGPASTQGQFSVSPWKAWMADGLVRSGGESFDPTARTVTAGPASLMACGPSDVPGSPTLGACSVGLAYTIGRYSLLDLATGATTATLELPWSAAIRSTAASRPTVMDADRFVLSAAEGLLNFDQYDHVYLIRRR